MVSVSRVNAVQSERINSDGWIVSSLISSSERRMVSVNTSHSISPVDTLMASMDSFTFVCPSGFCSDVNVSFFPFLDCLMEVDVDPIGLPSTFHSIKEIKKPESAAPDWIEYSCTAELFPIQSISLLINVPFV